ncbi:hypothetical protein [Acanthamoeba castellanii mimivirus]|uniref:Uncharacterized protein R703 n=4 Tax=Mimivirus TaxID=315393 RepID=YR703_MIMIV|nr:hypothetical protein MIMI_gp0761 [Acanthamoeba polyphaga mimivirus]Q5UNW5.1 RecName: Full=Uncharacterized protein R703 [Acanthamoeba polyphaga mimivirus]AEQ60914.1 hypothetical protein [Acanthamoeba castellanii mamavirus]AHA45131.1 hypothetical protein HIRU_S225 [Hirudovirus strain Sangsue]ALR84325.1 hypothetical protein [Niemeyer virus]AMZ03147.1 hypothetical protein [Mimivirus Bombay]EJN41113.1 hypothetical protein lvs_R610 [Acanthamoeba polyphaga lentillevirus]QTF49641.1 hypothetical p
MIITYKLLRNYLLDQDKYHITVKNNYLVISVPDIDYHVTVFQDQWDDYFKFTKKPYHLFHISSNSEINKCSSYFWVGLYENRIQNIPRKYFKYNQDEYNFYSSTRSPCVLKELTLLLKHFQYILNKIKKMCSNNH